MFCATGMPLTATFCFLLVFVSLITPIHSGRFPSLKTWWTRQITYDLHIAGRLTGTQIKYAKEVGFRSVISLFDMKNMSYIGPGDLDPLPSTTEADKLSRELGLRFATVLSPDLQDDEWKTESTMERFSRTFDDILKPVLLYDYNGYSSLFIGLMHYLKRSKEDAAAEPKMDSTIVFQTSSIFGYSYADDNVLKSLVLKIDNSENALLNDEQKVLATIPKWYRLPVAWHVKPLFKNIYISGQMQTNHLRLLKETGFQVMVNARRGVTSNGKPSQEEVILLNVKDWTGTYDSSYNPFRQTRRALERNRINPSRPNSYISPDSQVNYQLSNAIQFGDHLGYNESVEQEAVKEAGIEYIHAPVGGVYKYGLPLWLAFRDQLMRIGRSRSRVLIKCKTGYRSVVLGMLMYGCLYGHNSSQVLQRAYTLGFEFRLDREPTIIRLIRDVLDNQERFCEKHSPNVAATTSLEEYCILLLFACLSSLVIYR